jgi:hypothetical protein
VLHVLNEIVRAHGELMWSVVYAGPERRGVVQAGPHISFRWFDGYGIGGVPVRRQAAQEPDRIGPRAFLEPTVTLLR